MTDCVVYCTCSVCVQPRAENRLQQQKDKAEAERQAAKKRRKQDEAAAAEQLQKKVSVLVCLLAVWSVSLMCTVCVTVQVTKVVTLDAKIQECIEKYREEGTALLEQALQQGHAEVLDGSIAGCVGKLIQMERTIRHHEVNQEPLEGSGVYERIAELSSELSTLLAQEQKVSHCVLCVCR
jgi:hypothetical protein